EVGHLHLGAGRKIPQRLTRINQAIENNKLREKKALKEALQRAEKNNTTVHFAGIISDGGIHGHIDHLKALLEISSDYDVDVKIHCFTDGRD
ncbi:MAG: 2,3-bisphosphoglycerate-independent phosphoglycerate mutase, partial [Candidatus Nanohalobium sp.]